MSERRKRTAKGPAPVRASDPAVIDRARRMAAKYRLVLEPDASGGFKAHAIEMPRASGAGRTADKCVDNTRAAIVSAVVKMLVKGDAPPLPAGETRRVEQINIRVSPEDRILLEEAARQQGCRSVADYVRRVSIRTIR